MGKIHELVHTLWIRAKLVAPASLQTTVIPCLHEAIESARLVAQPRLPVTRLHGRGAGGVLDVTYAGLPFARTFLSWLVKAIRDGQWVSGVVCSARQDALAAVVMGVRDGDARLIREAAATALYPAAILAARDHGCEAVDFLRTAPCLSDGLFQHKRKWGTAVRLSPNLHRQVWIRIQRYTPAVAHFLQENPFIVVDGQGRLHGRVVVDDPAQVSAETWREWEKRYATPGLSSFSLYPLGALAPASANTAISSPR
jgi:hypothetical protein